MCEFALLSFLSRCISHFSLPHISFLRAGQVLAGRDEFLHSFLSLASFHRSDFLPGSMDLKRTKFFLKVKTTRLKVEVYFFVIYATGMWVVGTCIINSCICVN